MGFPLALIFVSAAIASASGLAIESHNSLCPPPEQIHPCTCFVKYGLVRGHCKDIKNQGEIRDVFDKNPGWKLQVVEFEQCSFDFVPSSIVKTASFQVFTVTSTTLVSLFDATPVKTKKLNVYLKDVKILRGMNWEFFSNANLFVMKIENTEIRSLGNSFKTHMPDTVQFLWLQNTKITKISDQAFQRLVNLETLGIMGGSLKKVSRDMFPRPWNISYLKLGYHKLSELPKDFFADLPNLSVFDVEGNHFTTINEELFTKRGMSYMLDRNPINCNCQVKWITAFSADTDTRFYGKCSEPESFKGRDLLSLKKEEFEYCQ